MNNFFSNKLSIFQIIFLLSTDKQFKSKIQENEKLKDDINDLQLNLENVSKTLSKKCITESEIVVKNLNIEISEYKKFIKDLENENETSKLNLEKCTQNVSIFLTEFYY